MKSPDKKKEAIFSAALTGFNKKGFAETTLSKIAEHAGISKGGLFYYFTSKRQLFLELFIYRVTIYSEQLSTSFQKEKKPEKRLHVFLKEAGNILKKDEDFYRFCLEFLAMGARDAEIRTVMTRFYKDTVAIFTRMVNEGMDSGRFKKRDAKKVSRILYLVIMGTFFTFFSINSDFEFSDQLSFQTDFLLKAMER